MNQSISQRFSFFPTLSRSLDLDFRSQGLGCVAEGVEVACEGKAEAHLPSTGMQNTVNTMNTVKVKQFQFQCSSLHAELCFLLLPLEKHSMAHACKACFKSCRKGFDSFGQEQEFQSSKCGKTLKEIHKMSQTLPSEYAAIT